VSSSADGSIALWECDNVRGGKWRCMHALKDLHTFPVYSVDVNIDNGMIISGGGDNALCLCHISRSSDGGLPLLERVLRLEQAHSADVNCVRWCPRSEFSDLLASVGDDGLLKLWRFAY